MAFEMMVVDTFEEQALAFLLLLLVGKITNVDHPEDHEVAMVVVLHFLVDKMVDILLLLLLLHCCCCWVDMALPCLPHGNTVFVAMIHHVSRSLLHVHRHLLHTLGICALFIGPV